MALGGALGRAWAPVTPRHVVWQAWHKLTSTVVSRGRRGTNSHLLSVCVAGVGQMALGGALGRAWAPVTPRHFAWQAWHKLTSTVVLWQAWHKLTSTLVLRGRRGTDGIGWRAWTGLGACDAAALCVAGVAQTHIYCRFTWQAWHKRTSDGIGWRAWTGLGACDAAARCVAGVARTFTYCRFTWQAWHQLTSTVGLRGRRGTDGIGWRAWTGLGACDAAALCVAGVVLPACFFVLPACFFVPRASACLLLACLSTFFCRLSTCFGMFDFGMFKFGHLHAKTRSFWHVSSFRVLRHVCLWHV